MTTGLYVALALIAAVLVYWFPIRQWYRRSDARRLESLRAMSGDTDLLVPDYESTLAISVDAPPSTVWDALLRFGWPREGRRSYEWLGRAFGFLQPAAAIAPASDTLSSIPIGKDSQIPVRSVIPTRALVLGGTAGARQWAWQFELTALDERHTRVILRDRARVADSLPAWLALALPRALSFVLTRKMLLDIKTAAESAAR